MNTPKIIDCGDDALRLIPIRNADRHGLSSALLASGDWREVVVGRQAITVQFNPATTSPDMARQRLENVATGQFHDTVDAPPALTLPVHFNPASAPDLAHCAEANDCSPEAFINSILASILTVDMIGFAPGFAYVGGVDDRLIGGRLQNPRVKVPAGSIGFIQGYLGIYALDGPGGWPIIGHTEAKLFDQSSAQPAILTAGRRILIEPV